MENIPEQSLKQYDKILARIDEEHAKNEQLSEELTKLNNEITTLNFLDKENIMKKFIFRTDIKVFDSIYDSFLSDYITDDGFYIPVEKYTQLYLIRVFIANEFKEKIWNQNQIFQFSIRNSSGVFNRIVSLSRNAKNQNSNADVFTIIPMQKTEEDSVVEVSLIWPMEKFSPRLIISKTQIDISYHFTEVKSKIKNNYSQNHLITSIAKLYNTNLNVNSNFSEYEFMYTLDNYDLFKLLFQNSYHRLDVRKRSICSSAENEFAVEVFLPNLCMLMVKFDSKLKKLSLKSSPETLRKIKKIIIDNSKINTIQLSNLWYQKLKVSYSK